MIFYGPSIVYTIYIYIMLVMMESIYFISRPLAQIYIYYLLAKKREGKKCIFLFGVEAQKLTIRLNILIIQTVYIFVNSYKSL